MPIAAGGHQRLSLRVVVPKVAGRRGLRYRFISLPSIVPGWLGTTRKGNV